MYLKPLPRRSSGKCLSGGGALVILWTPEGLPSWFFVQLRGGVSSERKPAPPTHPPASRCHLSAGRRLPGAPNLLDSLVPADPKSGASRGSPGPSCPSPENQAGRRGGLGSDLHSQGPSNEFLHSGGGGGTCAYTPPCAHVSCVHTTHVHAPHVCTHPHMCTPHRCTPHMCTHPRMYTPLECAHTPSRVHTHHTWVGNTAQVLSHSVQVREGVGGSSPR